MRYKTINNSILILVVILTSVFLNCPVVQAESLKSNKEFFETKLEEYKKWLAYTNISSVIAVDSLEIKSDKVSLRLKMPDKHNWIRLNEYTSKNYHKPIADILFDQFLFQADLEKEQLVIKVDGIDALVFIYYENNEIMTEMPKKMGPVSSSLDIPIDDLKILSSNISLQSKKMLSEIKRILKEELRKYFASYKTKYSDYKFDIIYDVGSKLEVDIRNIASLVLEDEKYFERIIINFRFNQEQDAINIQFSVLGKYAAGIIWSPKESRYEDMSIDYADQLKKFSSKLTTEINSILNNS